MTEIEVEQADSDLPQAIPETGGPKSCSPASRICQQLAFLAELDRLKSIVRQSPLADRSRRENSAEHSWHLAMFALILAEHAPAGVDAMHATRLLLVHDVVEIDAGDAPIHAPGVDRTALARAEAQAACRIFGLLPPGQRNNLLALWQEFEAAETPEALYAKALDRFQPLFLNTLSGGGTWQENDLTEAQVIERYGTTIERGAPSLWAEAAKLVRQHFDDLERGQTVK